jgi:hypothetical protein
MLLTRIINEAHDNYGTAWSQRQQGIDVDNVRLSDCRVEDNNLAMFELNQVQAYDDIKT